MDVFIGWTVLAFVFYGVFSLLEILRNKKRKRKQSDEKTDTGC